MKDFGALCARLSNLSQNPKPEAPIDEPTPSAEDYTNWGVPEDIRAYGLTGNKNPLLTERAAVTCRDCLLKGHKAGSPDCPQHEWRKELWGEEAGAEATDISNSNRISSTERPIPFNTQRVGYEFSEPIKVILDFDELGLKPTIRQKLRFHPKPMAIQQCIILPILQGRNLLAQAPLNSGKTTALIIAILQLIDAGLPDAQALVFTPTEQATIAFQGIYDKIGSGLGIQPYFCKSSQQLGQTDFFSSDKKTRHLFVGTPDCLLSLIRRNFIKMHKLKAVFLDDMDKLMDSGVEQQIIEVYRFISPLTQVVASFTTPLATANTVTRLIADPLRVTVGLGRGMSFGRHFFVNIPASQKISALKASFSALRTFGIVVLCNDTTEIKKHAWDGEYRIYYLDESMDLNQHLNTVREFTTSIATLRSGGYIYSSGYPTSISKVALIITEEAFLSTTPVNIPVPLVNYNIHNSAENYVKRLGQWCIADPAQNHSVIMFVEAGTDEIKVIRDLEQYYEAQIPELLYEGGSFS
ncbi:helicase superfamily c-terminal domain, partial [Rhizoctonia solani]